MDKRNLEDALYLERGVVWLRRAHGVCLIRTTFTTMCIKGDEVATEVIDITLNYLRF